MMLILSGVKYPHYFAYQDKDKTRFAVYLIIFKGELGGVVSVGPQVEAFPGLSSNSSLLSLGCEENRAYGWYGLTRPFC